jgi:transcriptional regulator with XRE-family HTH domain
MFWAEQSYAGGMPDAESPQLMLGRIIRTQRELAELPMRQLAATVGISNPYLSQIERGLRAPSEAVLNAIADSLQTSVDRLYEDAGFVEPDPQDGDRGPGDLQADIEAASELTTPQRKALVEIYRGFLDANTVRRARGEHQGD